MRLIEKEPTTLVEVLRALADDQERGITFIKSGENESFVSYADFYVRASRFLGFLQHAKGLQPGDELIIQEEDNERLLLCFWACLLGGIIPVPLAVGGKEEHRIKFFNVWQNLRRPHLFTDTAQLKRLLYSNSAQNGQVEPETITGHFIDAAEANHSASEPIYFESCPEDLAFVQYSSGSTGTPKGVMLTHRNLVFNASDIAERCALANTDRGLSWIPLTHDMGMIGFHLAFTWAGGSQLIMPTSLFIRRPLLWMEKSHQHAANLLYSPNFGYQYFLEALEGKPTPTWNLKSIRMIINGAEPISAEICRKFTQLLAPFGLPTHCISPAYGLAEASVCVSLERFDAPMREYFLERSFLGIGNGVKLEQSAYSPEMVSFVTVGKPVTHAQLRICDVHDAVLSSHTIGQIQIRGDNVTAGYYRNEAATAEIFTPDQWLRTGDLGFLTDDGSLVITGRLKNLIILQGQNYYPHDIEQALFGIGDLSLGKVVACGLSGSSQEKEQLLLFILFKKPLSKLVPLVEAVHNRLSQAMGLIPDYVIPVREIPKTTSGKVQHYRLLERFREGFYQLELEALQQLFACRLKAEWQQLDTLERTIEIKAWLQKQVASLLRGNPAELHPTVPLNDQGFKSIHSVQLRNILEQRLDMELSVGLLYRHPTLEKLTEFIDQTLFPDPNHRPMPPPSGWIASESLLQRAASLSDDQISRLLNEELL